MNLYRINIYRVMAAFFFLAFTLPSLAYAQGAVVPPPAPDVSSTPPVGDQQEQGWYLGGGVGLSMASIDKAGIKDFENFIGVPSPILSVNESSASFKLFGGFHLNRNFALELGLVDFGKVGAKELIWGDTFDFEVIGTFVSGVGSLPMDEQTDFLIKFGFINWRSDSTVSVYGVGGALLKTFTVSENGIAPILGLGVETQLDNNISLRGELEHYAIDVKKSGAGDFIVMSVGGIYHF
ncbi:MAG: outer membrane beta-barrel protein [Deltaproteobacteria bacterium]|nr:outer membrane beta-barrel protein [Deltaproteobacteria bacterium]